MKNFLQLNPFSNDTSYTNKHPNDMSVEELQMLLHIQRLNIQLEIQKVKTNINQTKFLIETAKELGLFAKVKDFLASFTFSNACKEPDTDNYSI
jgi:hypothetical protein